SRGDWHLGRQDRGQTAEPSTSAVLEEQIGMARGKGGRFLAVPVLASTHSSTGYGLFGGLGFILIPHTANRTVSGDALAVTMYRSGDFRHCREVRARASRAKPVPAPIAANTRVQPSIRSRRLRSAASFSASQRSVNLRV